MKIEGLLKLSMDGATRPKPNLLVTNNDVCALLGFCL